MSYAILPSFQGFGDDTSSAVLWSKQASDCGGMLVLEKGYIYDSCECPKSLPVRYGKFCGATTEEAQARSDKAVECELSKLGYDPSTGECEGVIPGRPETGWIDPKAGTSCGANAIYNTSGECVDLGKPNAQVSPTQPGSTMPLPTLAKPSAEAKLFPLVMIAILLLFGALAMGKKEIDRVLSQDIAKRFGWWKRNNFFPAIRSTFGIQAGREEDLLRWRIPPNHGWMLPICHGGREWWVPGKQPSDKRNL